MSGSFVNPQPVDFLGPFLRNQLAGLQVQAARQKMQQQNALAALYRTPGNVDPATGSLTPQAMQQVMSIDPLTGMDIRKTEAQLQNQQAERQLHTTEMVQKKQALLQDSVRGPAMEAYDQALQAGLPEAQARAAAQRVYSDGLDDLRQSGAFSAQEQQGFIPQFDPTRVRANALSYKDWLAARDREAQQGGGSGPAPGLPLGGGPPAGDIGAAIFAQESGSGANPQTSPSGAVGGYQIMPATFRQYARPGERIDNPADNAAVGNRIIADLSQQFGGDPARIAVGYFSGPQNVAPPGSPTPWIEDRKDATGKSTSSYVSDVLGRLRGGPILSGSGGQQGTGTPEDLVSDDPKRQASALDALARNLASDVRPKDAADAKSKATLEEAQLLGAAALLRSGDPDKIARGREIAERITQSGPGLMKGTTGGVMDDKTLDFAADQVLAGDTSAMQNFGRGAQGAENLTRLRKRVMEKAIDKGMSGADLAAVDAQFKGIQAGEQAAGKRGAQLDMAVSAANKFATLAIDAYDKLPRTDFVPFNRLEQLWQSNTSSPEQGAAYAAVNSFINAYARAISPTGTPTVSDKDHAREMLSTAMGPAAFHAVIDQLKKEMQAETEAPGVVRQGLHQAVTGKGDVGSQQPAKPPEATTKKPADMTDDELRRALGLP